MNKDQAIARLGALKKQAPTLDVHHQDASFIQWRRDCEVAISDIFQDERHPQEWSDTYLWRDFDLSTNFRRRLAKAEGLLGSMIEEVKHWDEERNPKNVPNEKSPDAPVPMEKNEIFIIHGHDEGFKATVARFIENQKIKTIILHEQPNEGKTIIEKLEKHSSVGFAIALLSPDDVGGKKTDNLQGRARQNVIFEMGYFFGKLGRHRVCALKKTGVETPSDYDGVVYIPIDDAGAWKLSLVKELRAAGFPVDADKIA